MFCPLPFNKTTSGKNSWNMTYAIFTYYGYALEKLFIPIDTPSFTSAYPGVNESTHYKDAAGWAGYNLKHVVRNVSDHMLLTDAVRLKAGGGRDVGTFSYYMDTNTSSTTPSYGIWFVHGGKGNFLMSDGHVDTMEIRAFLGRYPYFKSKKALLRQQAYDVSL